MEDKKKEIIEVEKVENTEETKKEQVQVKTEKGSKKGFCIASMVLGIVSVVLFCLWYIAIPCAILALVFGIIGVKGTGRGMAIAGIVTSSISLVLSIIIVIGLFILGFAIGFSDVFDELDNYDRSYYHNYHLYD